MANVNLTYLSDEDLRVLKELIAWKKNQPPSRRIRQIGEDEPRIVQTPDVYIALPPSEGIPPLIRSTSGTGTGSDQNPGENDQPGTAMCTLAMIVGTDNLSPEIHELNEVGQVLVYNVSPTTVDYDWIQVHRDKFGRWMAITPGGGCERQNTIWDITVFGAPTGGTITLTVTVNGVTQNVTINWNDNSNAVAIALATHTEIATTANINFPTGGTLPNQTIQIEFIGNLAGKLIVTPAAGFGSLTGGTGRGVIVAMSQRGHS